VISTIKKLDIKLGENGNMKANRKFVEGEEAVSAVIGVILMVAITVAIAATVYVYVSGMLGGTPTRTPEIQFTPYEDTDRLSVSKTDGETDWSKLSIRSTEAIVFWINDDATSAGDGTDLAANTLHPIVDADHDGGDADVDIDASDFIDLAGGAQGAGADKTDVEITLVHSETNTVLGTYTFQTIAAAV